MNFFNLKAISPIDGRYHKKTNLLKDIFSEYALLKYRLIIEIHWLKKLLQILEIPKVSQFTDEINKQLDSILESFCIKDAEKIKIIEKTIKHDVKALEYYLRKKFLKNSLLRKISEFIHFGCTSDDINNLAYALMLKKVNNTIIIPYWKRIKYCIKQKSINYKNIPMLSYTHGQPATPSTLGKEFANFFYRINRQYNQIKKIEFLGKINGSTGNYNALFFAYPSINWHKVSEEFVTSLGITWNPYTTQIEPHDYISEFFSCISRFNTILIDFNRDVWGYISRNYFNQKYISQEVGSSTMPHKINPIDFENSEGNLSIANSLMSFMSHKLPISRFQRDLTDSTILRNIGSTISYSIIAYDSCLSGINKLNVNKQKILEELNLNWNILAEPIQTLMKRYGIKDAYEQLKELTRNAKNNSKQLNNFIDKLVLPDKEKKRLKELTPNSYIGMAIIIVNNI